MLLFLLLNMTWTNQMSYQQSDRQFEGEPESLTLNSVSLFNPQKLFVWHFTASSLLFLPYNQQENWSLNLLS